MYAIKVEETFSSAHNLRGYKGKCEELHGHNWRVEITVKKNKLDKIGMVEDFKYLKNQLNAVLETLDHKYLNDLPYFSATRRGGSAKNSGGKKNNPTSENIAKYIYDCLKKQIQYLGSVTVWESDKCCATYYEK
jgi:6-pyruvoyltetrahydropterin/6-carboxytetrahydropterin synthase